MDSAILDSVSSRRCLLGVDYSGQFTIIITSTTTTKNVLIMILKSQKDLENIGIQMQKKL